MTGAETSYRLELMGTFRLNGPEGERIEIVSKKGMALVAMLAMASRGERTRAWLQDRLWGSRQKEQAQQSLRREIGNLRKALPANHDPLIYADHDRVSIDLSRCCVDALDILSGALPHADAERSGEFLEGFDIAGEEGFEDWLRHQRRMLSERLTAAPRAPPAAAAPQQALSEEAYRRKPTLAVLPVSTEPENPELAAAGLRMGEELVDRLARIRWLSVVSPGTVVAIRAGVADRTAIGSAVGARYLLELRLLRRRSHDVISATLMDASTWRTILSQRIEAVGRGEAAVGEDLRDLVAAIDSQVETAEQERVLQKPSAALTAQEIVWRARWHLERLTRADAAIAQRLLDTVLAEAPDWSEALIQSGFCKAWSIWTGRGGEQAIIEMRRLGTRAVAADRFDARGHLLIGMADTWLRRPDRARLVLQQAISLNPSLTQAYMQLGSALYLAGDAAAALEPMDIALKLNPHDTQVFAVLAERGMVHCMLGRWRSAIESAEQSLLRKPGYWYAHIIKINALVRLGDLAAARGARADLRRSKPNFAAGFIDWLPFLDEAWPRFLKEGLAASEAG